MQPCAKIACLEARKLATFPMGIEGDKKGSFFYNSKL
jgi:hypothetical protein